MDHPIDELMGEIERLAENFGGKIIVSKDGKEKVERTIPCKPEWLELYKEFKAEIRTSAEHQMIAQTIKDKFWVMVRDETGINDRNLKFNTKELEIEVIANDD